MNGLEKFIRNFCLSILSLHIALIIYTNRALYTKPFDEAYWKDKYEQSQWILPTSVRTLGDDGLYLYEGYRLIHGGDPTVVNAEIPPLGKYTIGLCIRIIKNGYIFGLLCSIAMLVLFYKLSKKLIGNTAVVLVATTLLALDPLMVKQFSLTMLDSIQLVFLLAFFLVLAQIELSRRKTTPLQNILLLGFMLGCFSSAKPPFWTPFFAGIACILLYKKTNRLISPILFVITTGFTYMASYLQYFISGHSILDWLKVQKWIFAFYEKGGVLPKVGSIFSTIFLNQYKNLFSEVAHAIEEWTALWPLITVYGLIGLFVFWKNNTHKQQKALWLCLFATAVFLFIVYTFIPFWIRYFVLLLPFLYLGTMRLLYSQKMRLFEAFSVIVFILVNSIRTILILFPTPESVVNQFVYDWRYGFFQDMYEQFGPETTEAIDRQTFRRMGQKFFSDASIEWIDIMVKTKNFSRWQGLQRIPLSVTYHTRELGSFTETPQLTVAKHRGRWRIVWSWDTLIHPLQQDYTFQTNVVEAKRGSLIKSDGNLLAKDFPSFLVWITPRDVDKEKEEEMITCLQTLIDSILLPESIHYRYIGNRQPDWPAPILVISHALVKTEKEKLLSFSGVSITPALGRMHEFDAIYEAGSVINTSYFECCSLLYSTTTYDGSRGLEEKYNDILKGYNGGSLVLKDRNGNIIRKIIETQKKDGKDVRL